MQSVVNPISSSTSDKIRYIRTIRVRFTSSESFFDCTPSLIKSVESVFVASPPSFFSNTDFTLSLQKNATQSHKLQNNQGKSMIAEDSFVPLL